MHLSTKEIDLRFQYRYHDTYPRAIGLVASGVIDVKPLVTHRFTLEQGLEAFTAASDPSAMALKVQILDEENHSAYKPTKNFSWPLQTAFLLGEVLVSTSYCR